MSEYSKMKRFALGLTGDFPDMGEGSQAVPAAITVGSNQIGGLFSDFAKNPLDMVEDAELVEIVKMGLSFFGEYAADAETSVENAQRLAELLQKDDGSLEAFLNASRAAEWLSRVFLDADALHALARAVRGAPKPARAKLAEHLDAELERLMRFKATLNELKEACV